MAKENRNVDVFTHLTPIPVATNVQLSGVTVGSFGSLSFLGYSDQPFTVRVEFSGDGKNYDYYEDQSFLASTAAAPAVDIRGQWVRLTLIETSGVLATEFRLFVYGRV